MQRPLKIALLCLIFTGNGAISACDGRSDLPATASPVAAGGEGDDDASGGAATGGRDASWAGQGGSPEPSGGDSGSDDGPSGGAFNGGAASEGGALGAYPTASSPITRGGTMTFQNMGAPGSWPRRLDRHPGDPACDYKDGEDTWGGHCCQTEHQSESDRLAPFDEEMTLILKAIDVKQLAIYQPEGDSSDATSAQGDWTRVTAFDDRGTRENLWFTQSGEGNASFPGDLTKNDCVGYVMQEPLLSCGDGADYYCPDDPDILHRGFSGSKLVVFLANLDFEDESVRACNGDGAGHPGPWVAFVASELVRDGGRKWNGLCNCYSKTGSVGDGCGEINVLEVVMDNNDYSNREFASTGVRSYQEGHIGGAVCMKDCDREQFSPLDVDVVDACSGVSYQKGPEIVAGGSTDGCPVWRRPRGDRYFFILLDEVSRSIQVGMVHPEAIPEEMSPLLPTFQKDLSREAIDALVNLRLPQ